MWVSGDEERAKELPAHASAQNTVSAITPKLVKPGSYRGAFVFRILRGGSALGSRST
jgi:hypothetical protein